MTTQAQPVAQGYLGHVVIRSAFRASPDGQDAEGREWLEFTDDTTEKGAFAAYATPQPAIAPDDTSNDLTIAYMSGFSDGKRSKPAPAQHLKAAAQQALTVLRGCLEHPDAGDAISALQHAIAQPVIAPTQAQPEFYQYQTTDGRWHGFADNEHYLDVKAEGSWPIRALYATPQPAPAPEWVMLTVDEIFPLYSHPRSDSEMVAFAREVIAAFIAKQGAKHAA